MNPVFFTKGENGACNLHFGDITTAQVLSELDQDAQIDVLNISLTQSDGLSSSSTIAYDIKRGGLAQLTL